MDGGGLSRSKSEDVAKYHIEVGSAEWASSLGVFNTMGWN